MSDNMSHDDVVSSKYDARSGSLRSLQHLTFYKRAF